MSRNDGAMIDPLHAEIVQRKFLLHLGAEIWTGENAVDEWCDHVSIQAPCWISIEALMEYDLVSLRNVAEKTDGWMSNTDSIMNLSSPQAVCLGRCNII
jgi:hypothetical protein